MNKQTNSNLPVSPLSEGTHSGKLQTGRCGGPWSGRRCPPYPGCWWGRMGGPRRTSWRRTGRVVVWAHASPFSPHRAHPWVPPPIKYRSLQKTSTSKPKVRFLRKKRRRKREKVCFSLVWCRWFTQKWLDGHAWMDGRDGSPKRRSDARTVLDVWGPPPAAGKYSDARKTNPKQGTKEILTMHQGSESLSMIDKKTK